MCYRAALKRVMLIAGFALGFLLISAATSFAEETHTVKRGDTLSAIAQSHGTTWQEIHKANRSKVPNPDLIYPGQKLVVPSSTAPPSQRSSSASAPPLRCEMRLTQHYGNPGSYSAGHHTGVDFGACGDDRVQAVRSGTVVQAGWDDAWGYIVIVQHGERYSWYAHLSGVSVTAGQPVSAGDRVGTMGNTGNSRGKHLHYGESVGGYRYSDQVRPVLLGSHGY